MNPFTPDSVGSARAGRERDHSGAWAAAAVLVLAVVLASGAVG